MSGATTRRSRGARISTPFVVQARISLLGAKTGSPRIHLCGGGQDIALVEATWCMLRTVVRATKCAGEMKIWLRVLGRSEAKRGMIEMVVRRRSDEDNDEFKALRKALGRRIAKLRMLRGVSQRQFADLADVSHASYGLLEAGHANVTLMLLDRVAKAMGVPLVSLFEDTPAQTTTGMEGLLVRLLGELVRLRRESEVRRDDFARLADETQAFLDANQETLNKLALDGQLSETERKARD